MFQYKQFKNLRDWKNKCWYILRIMLQCVAIGLVPAIFDTLLWHIALPISNAMGLNHMWNLSTEFDTHIPLVKVFAIPYALAIPWWYIAPIFIYLINGKKIFYRYLIAEITCEFIGALFLVFIQSDNSALRPLPSEYAGGGFLNYLLRSIYATSANMNFPSFHVLNTWTIFIAARTKDENGKRHGIFTLVTGLYALLVSLAVLFVRQHWIIDMFFAIVIAEVVFAMWALHSRVFKIQNFMTWFNTGVKIEPLSFKNNICKYRNVTKHEWYVYISLFIIVTVAMIVASVCLAIGAF